MLTWVCPGIVDETRTRTNHTIRTQSQSLRTRTGTPEHQQGCIQTLFVLDCTPYFVWHSNQVLSLKGIPDSNNRLITPSWGYASTVPKPFRDVCLLQELRTWKPDRWEESYNAQERLQAFMNAQNQPIPMWSGVNWSQTWDLDVILGLGRTEFFYANMISGYFPIANGFRGFEFLEKKINIKNWPLIWSCEGSALAQG